MMKDITKTEFDQWLKDYPRILVRDVCGIAEPPFVTWNDFWLAPVWPDSIVAQTVAGSGVYSVLVDKTIAERVTRRMDGYGDDPTDRNTE